jgi:hypothetical protein
MRRRPPSLVKEPSWEHSGSRREWSGLRTLKILHVVLLGCSAHGGTSPLSGALAGATITCGSSEGLGFLHCRLSCNGDTFYGSLGLYIPNGNDKI